MRKSVVATVAFGAAAMLALTLMPVAPLSTPAAAKIIVPENKIRAACKRTPGCSYNPKEKVGCSPNACFYCTKGGCYQVIRGTKTPSPRGDLGTLVNSPKGATGTKPQGTRAPLGTVGVKSTTPKGPNGPTLGDFRWRPVQD